MYRGNNDYKSIIMIVVFIVFGRVYQFLMNLFFTTVSVTKYRKTVVEFIIYPPPSPASTLRDIRYPERGSKRVKWVV